MPSEYEWPTNHLHSVRAHLEVEPCLHASRTSYSPRGIFGTFLASMAVACPRYRKCRVSLYQLDGGPPGHYYQHSSSIGMLHCLNVRSQWVPRTNTTYFYC